MACGSTRDRCCSKVRRRDQSSCRASRRRSRLVEVVSYERDVQMPPDGKLADDQIDALKVWIKLGLPWPENETPAEASSSNAHSTDKATADDLFEQARARHWAFQPIGHPAPPTSDDSGWSQSPLDQFVFAELTSRGLTPSPPVSKAVLLRRATFDLIGLPATADEIEAFERDPAPDAFARAIDRLLASPEYGQRWGRHWLDVARYADTKGYVFTQDPRFPYSYTYRDYVVRALNEDLPYDRFVTEQLAADLLPLGEDKQALAALGFLTLGSRFMNNTHDIIDDEIDVVLRGLLGLTVAFARCHDHKYDPIPTADYYSLYGVFASTTEPAEQPLVAMPEENAAYLAHQKELSSRQQALDGFLQTQQRQITDQLRTARG